MSVPFKHGDQICHVADMGTDGVYTYIGPKGYGASLQYVYYDPKNDRAYHFTEAQAAHYKLYVPGLKVGKQYRFNDTPTGNVYKVLHEYRHPTTGRRTWQCEITTKGRDGEVSAMSPYPLREEHVSRLKMLDDEDEW